jgi:propanol-preferring alcohol dehydrogenase
MATDPHIVIPKTQTAALVRELGGPVEFVTDYPVPTPGRNEVLAKVLYTGVCQSGEYGSFRLFQLISYTLNELLHTSLFATFSSVINVIPIINNLTSRPLLDLHTKCGTAAGADGTPITNIKLPHVGGHEGVGRIVALGPGCYERGRNSDRNSTTSDPDLRIGKLVGIRFSSRICRRCEFCLAGTEQYCVRSTNHLHHEDGSFQEYIALDADYLTLLPDDVDAKLIGPVLCAGVTAYKAVLNTNVKIGDWLVVVGAGGGLGHLAGLCF